MAEVKTKEAVRQLLQDALPDIVNENPQILLDALSANADAFRKSMEEIGFIVGEDAGTGRDFARAAAGARDAALADGRIMGGFGVRFRQAATDMGFGRYWTSPLDGKQRVNYLC